MENNKHRIILIGATIDVSFAISRAAKENGLKLIVDEKPFIDKLPKMTDNLLPIEKRSIIPKFKKQNNRKGHKRKKAKNGKR